MVGTRIATGDLGILHTSYTGEHVFLNAILPPTAPVALCRSAEKFHQTLFIKITHWRLATWLNPLRMLEPQVVANLLAELGKSMNLTRRDRCAVQIFDPVARCVHRSRLVGTHMGPGSAESSVEFPDSDRRRNQHPDTRRQVFLSRAW